MYGLIEDKTFKEEVTLFRIDTDNDVIRPEHREELIPIVMRYEEACFDLSLVFNLTLQLLQVRLSH